MASEIASDDLQKRLRHLSTLLSRSSEIIASEMNQDSLSDMSSKLPNSLDRAKINVFTSYVLLSLIYANLRLNKPNQVSDTSHPVRVELERIKSYFEKIQLADNAAISRKEKKSNINVDAAERFIKSALSSNKHIRNNNDNGDQNKARKKRKS